MFNRVVEFEGKGWEALAMEFFFSFFLLWEVWVGGGRGGEAMRRHLFFFFLSLFFFPFHTFKCFADFQNHLS